MDEDDSYDEFDVSEDGCCEVCVVLVVDVY